MLEVKPNNAVLNAPRNSVSVVVSSNHGGGETYSIGTIQGVSVEPSFDTARPGAPVTVTITIDRSVVPKTGSTVVEFLGPNNIATFTLRWSAKLTGDAGTMALGDPGDDRDFQGQLNRLAKTTGLAPAMAARIWAGAACPEFDVQGCLNFKAFGLDRSKWLETQGVCNVLAGTTGLAPPGALGKIATPTTRVVMTDSQIDAGVIEAERRAGTRPVDGSSTNERLTALEAHYGMTKASSDKQTRLEAIQARQNRGA